MNMPKIIAAFVWSIFLMIAGCDNSNPSGVNTNKPGKIDSLLVGNWECYKMISEGFEIEIDDAEITKIYLKADGTYEENYIDGSDKGTFRTKNDSLFITLDDIKIEYFYATYKFSGSEMILNDAGSLLYYRKIGSNNNNNNDISNITKSALYGNWVCYQISGLIDGQSYIIKSQDQNWGKKELNLRENGCVLTMPEPIVCSYWDYINGLIIIDLDFHQVDYKVKSLNSDVLVLEDDQGWELKCKRE